MSSTFVNKVPDSTYSSVTSQSYKYRAMKNLLNSKRKNSFFIYKEAYNWNDS